MSEKKSEVVEATAHLLENVDIVGAQGGVGGQRNNAYRGVVAYAPGTDIPAGMWVKPVGSAAYAGPNGKTKARRIWIPASATKCIIEWNDTKAVG